MSPSSRPRATASVLFANLGSRLQIEGAFGDTILWCHLAKHGKVRYREDVSSVYRRHAGGITGSNKVEWAKRMIEWNKALKRNHPQIDGSVFKKRNLENFKAAIDSLLEAQKYKEALLAVDELAELTDHPPAYKDELLTLIQERLKRRDRQSRQMQTGWSSQEDRPVAMPARGALKLFW